MVRRVATTRPALPPVVEPKPVQEGIPEVANRIIANCDLFKNADAIKRSKLLDTITIDLENIKTIDPGKFFSFTRLKNWWKKRQARNSISNLTDEIVQSASKALGPAKKFNDNEQALLKKEIIWLETQEIKHDQKYYTLLASANKEIEQYKKCLDAIQLAYPKISKEFPPGIRDRIKRLTSTENYQQVVNLYETIINRENFEKEGSELLIKILGKSEAVTAKKEHKAPAIAEEDKEINVTLADLEKDKLNAFLLYAYKNSELNKRLAKIKKPNTAETFLLEYSHKTAISIADTIKNAEAVINSVSDVVDLAKKNQKLKADFQRHLGSMSSAVKQLKLNTIAEEGSDKGILETHRNMAEIWFLLEELRSTENMTPKAISNWKTKVTKHLIPLIQSLNPQSQGLQFKLDEELRAKLYKECSEFNAILSQPLELERLRESLSFKDRYFPEFIVEVKHHLLANVDEILENLSNKIDALPDEAPKRMFGRKQALTKESKVEWQQDIERFFTAAKGMGIGMGAGESSLYNALDAFRTSVEKRSTALSKNDVSIQNLQDAITIARNSIQKLKGERVLDKRSALINAVETSLQDASYIDMNNDDDLTTWEESIREKIGTLLVNEELFFDAGYGIQQLKKLLYVEGEPVAKKPATKLKAKQPATKLKVFCNDIKSNNAEIEAAMQAHRKKDTRPILSLADITKLASVRKFADHLTDIVKASEKVEIDVDIAPVIKESKQAREMMETMNLVLEASANYESGTVVFKDDILAARGKSKVSYAESGAWRRGAFWKDIFGVLRGAVSVFKVQPAFTGSFTHAALINVQNGSLKSAEILERLFNSSLIISDAAFNIGYRPDFNKIITDEGKTSLAKLFPKGTNVVEEISSRYQQKVSFLLSKRAKAIKQKLIPDIALSSQKAARAVLPGGGRSTRTPYSDLVQQVESEMFCSEFVAEIMNMALTEVQYDLSVEQEWKAGKTAPAPLHKFFHQLIPRNVPFKKVHPNRLAEMLNAYFIKEDRTPPAVALFVDRSKVTKK